MKWKFWASRSSLVRLSTLLTAGGFLPAAVAPVRAWLSLRAETDQDGKDASAGVPQAMQPVLLHALLTSALSFFLFSFQVHEKTILLPLMPLTLLLSGASPDSTAFKMGVLANNVGVFSMWPLLKRDGLVVQYIALTLLWNRLIGYNPFRIHKASLLDFFALVVYTGCLSLHVLELLINAPAQYPDIYPVLNVLISTPIFALTWLWSIKSLIEARWAVGSLGLGSRDRRPSVSDKGHSVPSTPVAEDRPTNVVRARGIGREMGVRAQSLGYATGRRKTSRASSVVGG